MIVKWLSFEEDSPATGMWDQAMLSDILKSISSYESDRVVCVIPGKQFERYIRINRHIKLYKKVLVIITSDEESLFDTDKLEHPDMIVYSQYPTEAKSKNVSFWLPIGYTPHTKPMLKKIGFREKSLDWFFAGQVTHKTREVLYNKLSQKDGGLLLGTEGFTQGFPVEEYIDYMQQAKVAPSPHGVVVPEALRTYEALEAGALPIPEVEEYHNKVIPLVKLPYLTEWVGLDEHIKEIVDEYPKRNNLVQSQWQLQKYMIRQRLLKDLGIQEDLTILISTSPIKSHPSTEKIEAVINSVRDHLPDAQILIMADGVREEQKHIDDNYQEYLRKLLWKSSFEWQNVTTIVYPKHLHQLEATRQTLTYVTSKNILFVEHDIQFNGRPIDFKGCIEVLNNKDLDMIRFYFENIVPDPHWYLMLDKEPTQMGDIKVIRTAQWSQRPHIANTDYYRRTLNLYGSATANCMIEDAVYGHVADKTLEGGYDENRIAIYAPDGGFERCFHIDGRENESKFEDKMEF